MTRVVIQPASNPVSQGHYSDTVDPGLSLQDARIRLHLEPEHLAILVKAHKGQAHVGFWGVDNSLNGAKLTKWGRIQAGDRVFFTGQKGNGGVVYSTGVITHKFINRALADAFWPPAAGQPSWELMYAIADIRPLSVPYKQFAASMRKPDGTAYSPKSVPQGFNVRDEEHASELLALPAIARLEQVRGELEARTTAAELLPYFGVTDAEGIAQKRLEQGALRKYLLPGDTGVCDLCGRQFERGFLVAAHIKPRSECTDPERVDFDNVAMLNCTFGCDALYGRGLITVWPDGKLEVSPKLVSPSELGYANQYLAGNKAPGWTNGREGGFTWHRSNARKK